ncbi:hypothetical protein PMI41_04537 [Phyllobacterium sp. YR531]|nr:hypothetical protein PMI41_04537 [Phyllobacterium sp. YR531]
MDYNEAIDEISIEKLTNGLSITLTRPECTDSRGGGTHSVGSDRAGFGGSRGGLGGLGGGKGGKGGRP